jgi:hypothetical protein
MKLARFPNLSRVPWSPARQGARLVPAHHAGAEPGAGDEARAIFERSDLR